MYIAVYSACALGQSFSSMCVRLLIVIRNSTGRDVYFPYMDIIGLSLPHLLIAPGFKVISNRSFTS